VTAIRPDIEDVGKRRLSTISAVIVGPAPTGLPEAWLAPSRIQIQCGLHRRPSTGFAAGLTSAGLGTMAGGAAVGCGRSGSAVGAGIAGSAAAIWPPQNRRLPSLLSPITSESGDVHRGYDQEARPFGWAVAEASTASDKALSASLATFASAAACSDACEAAWNCAFRSFDKLNVRSGTLPKVRFPGTDLPSRGALPEYRREGGIR
jgi:hypothetical protein